MCAPALLLNSLHRVPAKLATFYFISGLESAAARPSIPPTCPIYGINSFFALSRQTFKRSINWTRTSSAIQKTTSLNIKSKPGNFWNQNFGSKILWKQHLHCSVNGYLFILAAMAGSMNWASSFNPTRSIALKEKMRKLEMISKRPVASLSTYFVIISIASSLFFSIWSSSVRMSLLTSFSR